MLAKETELASTDPILVHQVWIYRMQHGHFTGHHTAILNQVAALTGFSRGSFFGVRVTDKVLPVELPTTPVPMQPLSDNMEADDEMIDEEERRTWLQNRQGRIMRSIWLVLSILYLGCLMMGELLSQFKHFMYYCTLIYYIYLLSKNQREQDNIK